MNTIRFWTTHPETSPDMWMHLLSLDYDRYALVFDPHDPTVLIGTEHLFVDDHARRDFSRLYSSNRLAIFFAGECIAPDMNVFDYAFVFDRNLRLGDRIIRHPTLNFFSKNVLMDLTAQRSFDPSMPHGKTFFCNFLYSNPKAHPHRDWLFHVLSNYKPVDGLGPHLNTVGNRPSRNDIDWRRKAIELKRPYKFSIASENACYPGYVSEKLLSSWQAGTVPIYWGDPDIATEFNPAAFINANGMDAEELIATVRRIDEDDALWLSMVSQPLLTAEQAIAAKQDAEAYHNFTLHVFSKEIHAAKRVPEGYWTERYRHYFLFSPFKQSIFHKAKGMAMRLIRSH